MMELVLANSEAYSLAMKLSLAMADDLATRAADAIRAGAALSHLDQIPAAAYATDSDGVVIYVNSSCPEFTGRAPRVGEDRWCVTHKLYGIDGTFMPHEQCPMAEAILSRRPVRGVKAYAERPDGSRVAFYPVPTPIIGDEGQLVGAINIFVDVTEQQYAELRHKSAQARRLAALAGDDRTAAALVALANEVDAKAALLRAAL
jgi:PAS domain-containing protein